MRVIRYLGAGVVAAAAALLPSAVSIVNDFQWGRSNDMRSNCLSTINKCITYVLIATAVDSPQSACYQIGWQRGPMHAIYAMCVRNT